jgi:hypothetical protein
MPNSSAAVPRHLTQLSQWLERVLGSHLGQVRFRIQGNNLHILCEKNPCPDRAIALSRLLPALQRMDVNRLIDGSMPKIYHLYLYGRTPGQGQPEWRVLLYLNQIDRHLQQIQPSSLVAVAARSPSFGTTRSERSTDPESSLAGESSALVIPNRSLARRGDVEAIARYLSETLATLGIGISVQAKTLPYNRRHQALTAIANAPIDPLQVPGGMKRLWITCEAPYSPDPMVLAEPLAQKLRDLELEGFRDAITLIQVRGEASPDWMLRVDLTPTTEILREWARWGDVEAIDRLLKAALKPYRVTLASASLKQSTLHLTCRPFSASTPQAPAPLSEPFPDAPDRATMRAVVLSVLESLGPQGIHGAMLYGQSQEEANQPDWVEWLDLPAGLHGALAESPLRLAQRGDLEAIAFLMGRLLNPDLDRVLSTGGTRIQLLSKQDLLHVMVDAPICPSQQEVGRAIARFLKPLKISGIAGVRVYGRRAGEKRPRWSYGSDFVKRDRVVPEATPEFAVSDAMVGDLITRLDEPVLRPDLTPADLEIRWQKFWHGVLQTLQQGLIRTQLVTLGSESRQLAPIVAQSVAPATARHELRIAAVWGAVGCLLVLQADWLLGRWVKTAPEPIPPQITITNVTLPTATSDSAMDSEMVPELSQVSSSAPAADSNGFNASSFTEVETPSMEPSGTGQPVLASEPISPFVDLDAYPLPTFNSSQLDQKLALYYAHLAESGPPDVLIVGSSRALRGVDPHELERSLSELGYDDVSVFNFGINGATAQVVDLILRQILLPDQLPKLIIWADGARALNSGREDLTYNGIAASEAYQQLMAGTLPIPTFEDESGRSTEGSLAANRASSSLSAAFSRSYSSMDDWLSQQLAQRFTAPTDRDRLKLLLHTTLTHWLPQSKPPILTAESAVMEQSSRLVNADSLVEWGGADSGIIDQDGFLPLAIEFNPATYYQQYARVTGDYDRDYDSFRLAGKQLDALMAVMQLGEEQQIPIVFVNLPLTDEYLDPVRLGYEQEFQQQMVSLDVANENFLFRDLGELWPAEYTNFSDPSHLNQQGAIAVADRLAQDPLIPWSVMTQTP